MTITDYRNFDLLITRAGERYRAFVVDAPAGEDSVVFDMPFAPDAMPRLGGSGLVRGVSRHIGVADDTGSATSLIDVGSRLFEAIFQDKVQTLLAASLSSVAQEGAGLRLRLRFEKDAAGLATLPWETLYDPTQGHFVGLGEQSPILRYLSLPRSRSALLVEPPLRVLAVLSSPAGLPLLNMEQEWQAIQDALAGLTADDKFVLERIATPSLAALQDRLLGEPVHILHFVGHGVFDESSQAGSLALEDARGRPHLVRGEQLATLLRNHPAMRLAYLNACEGALASGQSIFTGVAQTLVREGLPAAVAMQAEITDGGAIELARTFYSALAAGRPVDAALTQARVALSVADSPEWAIPVLFSRSPDNRLFDIRQVLPTPDCPYPGMTPFSEAQKDLFFGRDKEIEDAVERLRQHPFLTVMGPSGSGKSSLIYAGVVPALRTSRRFGPGEWSVQITRPGQHPLAALSERLGCSPETLSSISFSERTLLFVDQLEEIFTLAEAGEAQAFLEALQGLIGRPNLHILLTVRADFYPEIMASSLWQPIQANRLELTPLGDDELWAAIVEPAAGVGVEVDEALAVKLIADASGQKGVLPLVQETLVLLWDKVKSRQLKLEAYKEMGEGGRSGLQVAIDRRATAVYNNLPDGAQAIARRIFLRLIQFGEGRVDTRRQQTVAELRASGDGPALFDQTLAKLTESRLLTVSGDAEVGERRVDIAHEALIVGWPRLQAWLAQRRTAEQTRRRLEAKAAEWVVAEKRGRLLDEYELQEAENWLAAEDAQELGYGQELADLVKISKEAIAQAAAEKEAQRQRELEQVQKLAEAQRLRAEEGEKAASGLRKRLIAAIVAVGIAVIAFGAAAWFGVDANKQKLEANRSARRAQAGELAVYAQTELADKTDPSAVLALTLAREAVVTTWGPDKFVTANADKTLRDAVDRAFPYPFSSMLSVAFSSDGAQIATGGADGIARIWDVRTGNEVYTLKADTCGDGRHCRIETVAYSPDGTQILTAGGDGTARIWDGRTGNEIRSLSEQTISIWGAAFSPDGTQVVTAAQDETVRTWDAATGREMRQLKGHTGAVYSAAYSPDGTQIVTASHDGTARIWDVVTGQQVRTLDHDSDPVWLATYSPDGKQIVTTTIAPDNGITNNIARIWDAATGEEIRQLSGHTAGISSVAFNLDGTQIVTADAVGTVRIRDAKTGQAVRQLEAHTDDVNSMTYSPDGQFIATASSDGTVRIWDARFGHEARTLIGHTIWILSPAFSPSGTEIITTSADHTSRIWNASTGREVSALSGHTAEILSAAFSPDSSQVVTASADHTARIWDARSGNEVRILNGHTASVSSAAFSPDGAQIVTASGDHTARLWDTRTGNEVRVLSGHTASVSSAVFSPNGLHIVTASEDRSARIWDANTGQEVRIFNHSAGVMTAAYSLSGQYIVTTTDDQTIRVWISNIDDLLAEATRLIQRDPPLLTPE